MKNIIGFSIGESNDASEVTAAVAETKSPVRSLVSVRFIGDGRAFTYYNDKFDLEIGDHVFVSGKLAGKLGVVEKVITKFKINLADYQRVISKASGAIHGTYESVMDKMVSYDRDALSPDEFRTWVMPPAHWDGKEEETEDEFVVGDGYELFLPDLEEDEDVTHAVLERALDYCRTGKVAYISVRNGIGTVEKTIGENNYMICGVDKKGCHAVQSEQSDISDADCDLLPCGQGAASDTVHRGNKTNGFL